MWRLLAMLRRKLGRIHPCGAMEASCLYSPGAASLLTREPAFEWEAGGILEVETSDQPPTSWTVGGPVVEVREVPLAEAEVGPKPEQKPPEVA